MPIRFIWLFTASSPSLCALELFNRGTLLALFPHKEKTEKTHDDLIKTVATRMILIRKIRRDQVAEKSQVQDHSFKFLELVCKSLQHY